MDGKSHMSSKKMRIVITVLAIFLVIIIPVYAWYTSTKRFSLTADLEIDMPPTIYIKDDNLEEITTFNLDGMTIGKEYNKVFCVSPAVVGSVNSFFLGVIYSENLGMDINIYPVTSVTYTEPTEGTLFEKNVIGDSTYYFNYDNTTPENPENYKKTYGNWTNETRPTEGQPYYGNLNYGVYKAYKNNLFSDPISTGTSNFIDELNDTRRYRFFILNVKWNENINLEANAKEADIVYIVAKGTMKLNQ